jgi:hypothetical protein
MSPIAERVVNILSRARLPLENEKRLQEAIDAELSLASVSRWREREIAGGRIDFAVPCLPDPHRFVGIEIKIRGSGRDIFRQVKAYCGDRHLTELIVASSRPLSLPAEINGKPVAVVDLGRAWL